MAEPRDDGWRDSGFSVDPATFGGVAGQLGKSFDDFNAAIALADGGECHVASAFNDYVSEAWTAFSNAWKQEMNITSQAIKELIDKTHLTAKNYAKGESATESATNAVAAALNGAI